MHILASAVNLRIKVEDHSFLLELHSIECGALICYYIWEVHLSRV